MEEGTGLFQQRPIRIQPAWEDGTTGVVSRGGGGWPGWGGDRFTVVGVRVRRLGGGEAVLRGPASAVPIGGMRRGPGDEPGGTTASTSTGSSATRAATDLAVRGIRCFQQHGVAPEGWRNRSRPGPARWETSSRAGSTPRIAVVVLFPSPRLQASPARAPAQAVVPGQAGAGGVSTGCTGPGSRTGSKDAISRFSLRLSRVRRAGPDDLDDLVDVEQRGLSSPRPGCSRYARLCGGRELACASGPRRYGWSV